MGLVAQSCDEKFESLTVVADAEPWPGGGEGSIGRVAHAGKSELCCDLFESLSDSLAFVAAHPAMKAAIVAARSGRLSKWSVCWMIEASSTAAVESVESWRSSD